jgi:hypothetical protein
MRLSSYKKKIKYTRWRKPPKRFPKEVALQGFTHRVLGGMERTKNTEKREILLSPCPERTKQI